MLWNIIIGIHELRRVPLPARRGHGHTEAQITVLSERQYFLLLYGVVLLKHPEAWQVTPSI